MGVSPGLTPTRVAHHGSPTLSSGGRRRAAGRRRVHARAAQPHVRSNSSAPDSPPSQISVKDFFGYLDAHPRLLVEFDCASWGELTPDQLRQYYLRERELAQRKGWTLRAAVLEELAARLPQLADR